MTSFAEKIEAGAQLAITDRKDAVNELGAVEFLVVPGSTTENGPVRKAALGQSGCTLILQAWFGDEPLEHATWIAMSPDWPGAVVRAVGAGLQDLVGHYTALRTGADHR